MQQEKKPISAVPIYGIGITWLLFAMFHGFPSLKAVLLCAVLSVTVFAILCLIFRRKPRAAAEPVTQQQPKQEEDPLLQKGAEYGKKLKELDEKIPDFAMSAKLVQAQQLLEHILDVVRKTPEKKKQIAQLMDYYLPTTLKLLEQYVTLQDQNIAGANIQGGMTKIADVLDRVIAALKKQLDGLFASDVVDITAEIRVMEKMLASEGLTDGNDF